jgi:protein TonB
MKGRAALAASRGLTTAIWLLGAVSAVALHAGGVALVVARMEEEPDSADMGAPAIAIGVEIEAPHREASELPPGPEAEASTASQAVQEQVAKAEESALPKDTPVESENPDQVVAPEAAEKPKEEEPETSVVQTNQSVESVASEATAAPSIETAKEAEQSVAPVQGTGDSTLRLRATWAKQVAGHIERHKIYPGNAPRRTAQVVVSFTIDRLGHVLTAGIAQSSGEPSFDEGALVWIRRADPLPPPPPLVADEGLSFAMPFNFRVKGR